MVLHIDNGGRECDCGLDQIPPVNNELQSGQVYHSQRGECVCFLGDIRQLIELGVVEINTELFDEAVERRLTQF
jgi:TFIIF-interacting CTD phosphatase-like protein